MKVAIAGKGGVGKTTVAAVMSILLAREGREVAAVDADSAGNLATALGIPKEVSSRITPLMKMHDLIGERTGVRPGSGFGALFRLNPVVGDVAERYSITSKDGVKLLTLGTIEHAEAGCFCPAHAFFKALLRHMLIRSDYLIIDLEAGIEHLGRGTTKYVDALAIVLEPGLRSIEAATKIRDLARESGISNILTILNKVRAESDVEFVKDRADLLDIPLAGALPFDEKLLEADMKGVGIFDVAEGSPVIKEMAKLIPLLVR